MSPRALLAVLATLALIALLPSTAAAKYDPLGSGSTRLTLDKGFLRLMAQNGVAVSAVSPATLKGRVLTFPVDGGEFDPTSGRGVVDHEGALLLKAGRRSIPLKDLQLKPAQKNAPFTVKAGGGQLKLATVAKLSVRRAGFGDKIAVEKLALSGKVAVRLAKKLRLRGVLEEGQPLGSTLTKAQPETIAVTNTGKAALTFDPSILAKLQGLFVALNPIFPAEHIGTEFTLPIFGGKIAPDGSSGVLETSGAIEALQLGGGQVFWQDNWFDLSAKTVYSAVNIQPSPPYAGKVDRIAIADLGLSAVPPSSNPDARTVSVSGATIALQAQTAATFNEVFARPKGQDGVFKAGEALGTISFTAHGQ